MRQRAAILLVGGLAVGWIATSRVARPSGSASAAPVRRSVTTTTAAPLPRRRSDPVDQRLRSLLPQAARCRGGSASAARCSVAGVQVDYRLVSRDAVRDAYLTSLVPGLRGASASLAAGSGPPACARGGEEERAWSRPDAPRSAVGRYACRIEEGRAAMWWTVDDRGLLAHAIAPDADLTSLFAWWESHSER